MFYTKVFGIGRLQKNYLRAIQKYKSYCSFTFETTKEDEMKHAIRIVEKYIIRERISFCYKNAP